MNGTAVQPPSELNPRSEPALDFREKPLHDMTPGDYDVLGFLSGLEVHQQLDTASKLFCRCPAGRPAATVDARVLRHMRPTLSELGEYDRTALMEFKTRKEVVYHLDRGTVCTYELDDTPPFEIDRDAVGIALEVAHLFGLDLVSELHVMRKQYLDGSIPTGFQRTAMVGLAGAVPLRLPELGVDRTLRIRQLSLEEDSCREVSDVGHRITFRTDRLGTPLTEVVTEPDLLTPWELQAGARLIADITRATGRVRRGPGAARQDVNVSVAGGRRVEIKGVSRHRGLPLLVHTEAFRQLELLRLRDRLNRRGLDRDALRDPEPGPPWETSGLVIEVGSLLRGSTWTPLADALARGETPVAIRLPGFAGLLTHRIQPDLTFAHELAERVRVIACPLHRPFLIHSDARDTIPGAHWRELRSALGAASDDAVVLVWAPRDDAATAAREILIRAREALAGVPAETRQARSDGRTGFERLLPGPDRMYPDTDTPPLPIADALVIELRDRLPERPWERQARYETLGLETACARRLARAPWATLFDAVEPRSGDSARRLAAALEKRVPFHARRVGFEPTALEPARVAPLVRALEAGEILAVALEPALDDVAADAHVPVGDVIRRYRPRPGDADRLRDRVAAVVARSDELSGKAPDVVLRWAMGEVMRSMWGRAAPEDVRARLVLALGAAPVEATA